MENDGEIRLYKDGNKWCAVRSEGFTNIQECHAGFSTFPAEAVVKLIATEQEARVKACHVCKGKGRVECAYAGPDGCTGNTDAGCEMANEGGDDKDCTMPCPECSYGGA